MHCSYKQRMFVATNLRFAIHYEVEFSKIIACIQGNIENHRFKAIPDIFPILLDPENGVEKTVYVRKERFENEAMVPGKLIHFVGEVITGGGWFFVYTAGADYKFCVQNYVDILYD